jgi:hypothetical protein
MDTLKQQSGTVDKGWYSSLGVGLKGNNSSWPKKKTVTKCYTEPWVWMNSFERPKQRRD